jgi:hypothetical protein
MVAMERLRFPIGPFDVAAPVADADLGALIGEIESAPNILRGAVDGLTPAQLDTAYRPDGWTVRQVVHHLADSHMNSLLRIKWALTEDEPLIKTYDERRWAELADGRTAPVDLSLRLLEGLHDRWVYLLRALGPDELNRGFRHPELGKISVRVAIAFYAWHGRHHTAHITALRARERW